MTPDRKVEPKVLTEKEAEDQEWEAEFKRRFGDFKVQFSEKWTDKTEPFKYPLPRDYTIPPNRNFAINPFPITC